MTKRSCMWPGCDAMVQPKMWGCMRHWFMLPKLLRDQIWAAYHPGQETDGRVSREYAIAAMAVRDWVFANHPPDEKAELKDCQLALFGPVVHDEGRKR